MLASGIICSLSIIIIFAESLTILKTIFEANLSRATAFSFTVFKAHIIRAFVLSSLLATGVLASGCQSMQLGASPIPVISYDSLR